MKKLIAVVGPTASGKTNLAIDLAKEFNGEVVSADSTQVYREISVGTGKVSRDEMNGIPHHLLDVASVRRKFSVTRFQRKAYESIDSIHTRKHLPILAGGTPLYVYSIIDGTYFPNVKPDPLFRDRMSKRPTEELLDELIEKDPQRAETVDSNNKRRIIRALEIIHATGQPVPKKKSKPLPYPFLMIGIQRTKAELQENIQKRIERWMDGSLLKEMKTLHDMGVSSSRITELGFEYQIADRLLQKEITENQAREEFLKENLDLARRQMLWLKKDPRIYWISTNQEAIQTTRDFIKTKDA